MKREQKASDPFLKFNIITLSSNKDACSLIHFENEKIKMLMSAFWSLFWIKRREKTKNQDQEQRSHVGCGFHGIQRSLVLA